MGPTNYPWALAVTASAQGGILREGRRSTIGCTALQVVDPRAPRPAPRAGFARDDTGDANGGSTSRAAGHNLFAQYRCRGSPRRDRCRGSPRRDRCRGSPRRDRCRGSPRRETLMTLKKRYFFGWFPRLSRLSRVCRSFVVRRRHIPTRLSARRFAYYAALRIVIDRAAANESQAALGFLESLVA